MNEALKRFWVAKGNERHEEPTQYLVALVDADDQETIGYIKEPRASHVARMLNHSIDASLRLGFDVNALVAHFEGEAGEDIIAEADEHLVRRIATEVIASDDQLFHAYHNACEEILRRIRREYE